MLLLAPYSHNNFKRLLRHPQLTGVLLWGVGHLFANGENRSLLLFGGMAHLQALHPREIRSAVMHDKTTTRISVDYYARKIIRWRWLIYPWAIHEDLSAFLNRLSPPPPSLEKAQQQLADQFGIRVSQRCLREVYAFMQAP